MYLNGIHQLLPSSSGSCQGMHKQQVRKLRPVKKLLGKLNLILKLNFKVGYTSYLSVFTSNTVVMLIE